MYYILSLLTGILISVMVAFNGGLTERYGVYTATVIVHIAGLLLISAVLLCRRERPFTRRQAWFMYLGGAIGVTTTIFNNLAFGRISVSAILALGLFGQSITGLVIDQYGLMQMPKHTFRPQKCAGLLLILGGIIAMVNHLEIIAVLVSLASGVSIVISRTLNAKLADCTNLRVSTFYNYFIGLLVSIPVCLLFGYNEIVSLANNEAVSAAGILSPQFYIYLGGVLGVCVVLLSNVTVAKISAFYLSLLLFVGQVFAGILIDAFISQEFSPRNLIGGLFVAAGLGVNLLLDNRTNRAC